VSRVDVLHPLESELDSFLYAFVGEDRNGSSVTVVSALARLGLDPWKEAAELASLGREVARARLESLLTAFKDVPTLALEHGAVAAELALLLPERQSHRVSERAGRAISKGPPISIGWIFAVLVIILVLARVYILANSG
jgi:hypothetical protein